MSKHSVLSALVTLSLVVASSSSAEVFHSKQSALAQAFPGATRVQEKTLYLSPEDVAWISKRAGIAWPGRVARAYVGYRGNELLGVGFIDTHKIRTLNETVMLVVNSRGAIKSSFVLAFHEPSQYRAGRKWWQQFTGQTLTDNLSLRREVDSISGATMTSHAGVAVVRRVLALFERKIATTRLSAR